MQETIVIEVLKDTDSALSWVCFSAEGHIIAEQIAGDPALLAPLVTDRHVIVLVPASNTLLLNVSLPPMNKQRLQQALPFAVEEEVLQDVEKLHIAPLFLEQKQEGNMPVLVVERAHMQTWLQRLKQNGITPDVMTSTLFGVPYEANTIHVLLDEPSLLRAGTYQGHVCDHDNLPAILEQFNTEQSRIVLHGESNNMLLPYETKPLNAVARLRMLATQVLNDAPINLLQQQYVSRKMRLPKGLFMQTLFGLAAIWLVLLLAYPLTSYMILKIRWLSLNNQVAAIYKKHFPAAKTLAAAKIRMEDKISQLNTAANEQKLLLQLAYFGDALKEVPSVDIKQLTFTEQKTELAVIASTAQDISRFVGKLSQHGLRVAQQNANLANDKVSVNLSVEAS